MFSFTLTGHSEGVFIGVGNFPRSAGPGPYGSTTGHFLSSVRLVCVTQFYTDS